MQANFNITSRREALLALTEVTQDNVFKYALAVITAIKNNVLSNSDAEWIIYEFNQHCEAEKIDDTVTF